MPRSRLSCIEKNYFSHHVFCLSRPAQLRLPPCMYTQVSTHFTVISSCGTDVHLTHDGMSISILFSCGFGRFPHPAHVRRVHAAIRSDLSRCHHHRLAAGRLIRNGRLINLKQRSNMRESRTCVVYACWWVGEIT